MIYSQMKWRHENKYKLTNPNSPIDDTIQPANTPPTNVDEQLTLMLSKVTELTKQLTSLTARAQAWRNVPKPQYNSPKVLQWATLLDPPHVPHLAKKYKGDSLTFDSAVIYKINILALYVVFDKDLGLPTLTSNGKSLLSTLSSNASFSYSWRTMHNATKNANDVNRDSLGSKASTYFIVNPSLLKKAFAGGMFCAP